METVKKYQIDNNIKYDNIILSRLDIFFRKKFSKNNINYDKLNIISILENSNVICDNFYMLPIKYFCIFIKIINKNLNNNFHFLKNNFDKYFKINYICNDYTDVEKLSFYVLRKPSNLVINLLYNKDKKIYNINNECYLEFNNNITKFNKLVNKKTIYSWFGYYLEPGNYNLSFVLENKNKDLYFETLYHNIKYDINNNINFTLKEGDFCIFNFNNIESTISIEFKDLQIKEITHNIYIICGNVRTFKKCFESCYLNIILEFCKNKNTINHVLFYLKIKDSGPKNQEGWNYSYTDLSYENINEYIESMINKYNIKNVYKKIIFDNEISETELINYVKDRSKYYDFLEDDNKLIRSMHSHYNFKKCGEFILNLEKEKNLKFNNLIYIRPDLFFKKNCDIIYSDDSVILGLGPLGEINDHIAIVPRKYLKRFFLDRINIYYTNDSIFFKNPESIYVETIKDIYIEKNIGEYYIMRE